MEVNVVDVLVMSGKDTLLAGMVRDPEASYQLGSWTYPWRRVAAP